MIGDCHLHTSFSLDSEAKMSDMVETAIKLGMKTICFTDHLDLEYPEEDLDFSFDTEKYFREIQNMNETYGDQIEVLTGVELGMQPQLKAKYDAYLAAYPFDFAIGSVHLVNDMDPYYDHAFEGRRDEDVFRDYFECSLKNVQAYTGFDSMGHLDYVVRYGREKRQVYTYEKFADIIDEILRILVNKGKALEINAAGLRKNLGFPNPHPKVIKRFKELGGEMITLGSDAHKPRHMRQEYQVLKDYLEAAGFSYYTIFRKHEPFFIKV